MFLKNHFQNAYITHDLAKAMQLIDDRFGKTDWIVFEPDMVLETPSGPRESSVKAALGWKDGLQIELIEPVKGFVDHYLPVLPADKSDFTPRFHHIAVRRDDEAAMRAEIAALGLPLAFEGPLSIKEAIPSLVFVYLDGRKSLGHYVEFTWKSPEAWNFVGWPEGRPVW
jgi:hypothetical protein